MKLVLDTNGLVATRPRAVAQHWFWRAFRRRLFTLCVTTDIIEEYDEVISRLYSNQISEDIVNEFLNAPNVLQINVSYNWYLITADPDDNKFVDCAVAANADAVVTHDRHFNVLKKIEFPNVRVLKLEDFHMLLSEQYGDL